MSNFSKKIISEKENTGNFSHSFIFLFFYNNVHVNVNIYNSLLVVLNFPRFLASNFFCLLRLYEYCTSLVMNFFIFVIDDTLSQENLSNTGISSPPARIGHGLYTEILRNGEKFVGQIFPSVNKFVG